MQFSAASMCANRNTACVTLQNFFFFFHPCVWKRAGETEKGSERDLQLDLTLTEDSKSFSDDVWSGHLLSFMVAFNYIP